MSRLAPIPGARPSSSRWRIPESERERVFERFYRVLGSGEDGSGLGLPIVREIAELHRGSVSLEPNPAGAGTLARVGVALPMAVLAVFAYQVFNFWLPLLPAVPALATVRRMRRRSRPRL